MRRRVIEAFATPILVYENEAHPRLADALVAECRAARERDGGVQASNMHGWHSATDLFQRAEPALAEVAGFIRGCLQDAARERGRGKAGSFRLALNGWININPRHAFNAPHQHRGSQWSGTYYVRVPEAEGRSGMIEFLDPRAGAEMVVSPLEFHNTKMQVRPTPGMLLLFPSWLMHWVYPNEEDEERISLAFNCSFVR